MTDFINDPLPASDLGVLRRIIDRGMVRAQTRQDSEFVDILQHLQDEWSRIPGAWEAYAKGIYT
jgi:hypothetical protein